MQTTNLKKIIDSILTITKPIISDSWSKRSLSILSVLIGFYFTNNLVTYLLDKSINTIFLSVTILVIMELTIRSLLFSNVSKLSIFILTINNFRIGSTYALILEAFKLGS